MPVAAQGCAPTGHAWMLSGHASKGSWMTNATSTNSEAVGDIPSLIALLEQQRKLYQQLRTLSDQQGPLVAEAQAEPLLGLLAQRQRLIDDLSGVNSLLEPFRQRWDALWSTLADAQRSRIGALVKEVQSLLAGIIQQDERDRQALLTARNRVATELQNTTRVDRAVNAYRAAPKAGAAAAGTPGIATGNNRFTNQNG